MWLYIYFISFSFLQHSSWEILEFTRLNSPFTERYWYQLIFLQSRNFSSFLIHFIFPLSLWKGKVVRPKFSKIRLSRFRPFIDHEIYFLSSLAYLEVYSCSRWNRLQQILFINWNAMFKLKCFLWSIGIVFRLVRKLYQN